MFSSKDTALFAVHIISTLTELDSVKVTQSHRDSAARAFGTSMKNQLRSELAEEEAKLKRMRNEVGRSPERQQAQRRLNSSGRNSSEYNDAQRELDHEEFLTAQSLQNIRVVEARVAQLRGQLDSLDSADERVFSEASQSFSRPAVGFFEGESPDDEESDTPDPARRSRPPPPPAPQRYSSPLSSDAQGGTPSGSRSGAARDADTPSRFTPSGPTTPAVARKPAASSNSNNTPMSTLAAKEMGRLSDQLENLTMRLLSTEKEKNALHKQLEESKQQAARMVSSEKSDTNQTGYASRESDLQRLNQQLKSQLKDTEEALAKAVREAAESDKQQAVAREDLEVARAEVSRNAAQRDELKRDLELIKIDNEKIRKV